MLRRLVVLTLIAVLFPAAANAWLLTVRVTGGSAGNYVTVTYGTTTKQLTAGTTNLYPTGAATATITTAAGSTKTAILDNVMQGASSFTWNTSPYANHSLDVTYGAAATGVNVAIAQTTGGTIALQLPNGTYNATGASNVAVGTGMPITISAATNYRIVDYTINGTRSTAGITGAAGQILSVTGYAVAASPTPNTITATYAYVASVTGTISAPTSGYTTQPVSCTGSATSNDTGIQYRFTVTAKPAGSAVGTATGAYSTTKSFSFTPDVAGTYTVRMDVKTDNGGAFSTSASIAVISYSDFLNSQCVSCHSTSTPAIVSAYLGSPHNGVNPCQNCHTAAHTALPTSAVCAGCHADSQGNVSKHPFAIGGNACTTCHDPHTTVGMTTATPPAAHFNNATGAKYPASYVTSRSTCMNCHFDDAVNATNRHQWAQSGHAATTDGPFVEYDFKTRAGCVQCHTATGFIAYSTGKVTAAWGVSADKTKELITCVACHKDITTGELRKVAPVKPFADDTYTNRNVGESNLCMDCHSGRNNGASIQVKVGTANFASQAFIQPHYLAAGGSLHGKSGYHFPGQTYAFYSSNTHRKIGMGDFNGTGTGGPCVACHKNAENGHTFQTGSISLCSNCHGASLPAGTLAGDKTDVAKALDVLKAALADKGFVYSATYPYFSNTNWGSGQDGANVMGAAYNYVLLVSEPGAYAHNSAYAKKLILDSIDVLDDGQVNNTVSTALKNLVDSGAIAQTDADAVSAYQGKTSCASCHVLSQASQTTHTTHVTGQSIGCAACHSATAASNTTLVPGGGQHLNGQVNVALAGGGTYSGGTAGSCSSVYCHSNGNGVFAAPAWGSAGMNCGSCHPIASLGGAHAAHVGTLVPSAYGDTGNGSTAAEYRFGCANCHPMDLASHNNGRVEVILAPASAPAGSLKSKNDPAALIAGIGNTGSGISGTSRVSVVCSAAYCHSNGGVGGTVTFVASPDWYNAAAYTGDRCAMCHGNVPATGAHAKHAVSIHTGLVVDGSGNLLAPAPAGTNGNHGDPAQATTITCNVCHSATVTNNANDKSTACLACHVSNAKGTPSLDRSVHLNGTVDVLFQSAPVLSKAQVRPTSFDLYSGSWVRSSYKAGAASRDASKYNLSNGSWNAATESCANVACHNGNGAKWTATLSCVDCHSKL